MKQHYNDSETFPIDLFAPDTQGEIRDRTSEAQHFRIAGLNLLAAIIIYWNTEQLGRAVQERELAGLNLLAAILIYWNTMKLGEAVSKRQRAGLPTPVELLAHVSPLGWEHINLTGEYRWRRRVPGA